MPEIRPLLERMMGRVELRPFTLEGFHDRRDRKRRDQRIAAGVVGIAVFVAVMWVLGTRVGQDTTAPADQPTGDPVRTTAEDVATDFLYATASYNTDQAVMLLADSVNLSGLRLGMDIGGFRRWVSFNEATGFQIIPTSCEETGSSSYGTYVRCMFDFHALRSEAVGRGPYSGSYIDVLVHDTPQGWGAIREVSGYLETAKVGPQMWEPFAAWVSTNYPEDVAVMYPNDNLPAAVTYTNHNLQNYKLTPRSIRLWEQHTREYVKAVQRGTA